MGAVYVGGGGNCLNKKHARWIGINYELFYGLSNHFPNAGNITYPRLILLTAAEPSDSDRIVQIVGCAESKYPGGLPAGCIITTPS